eukprot:m.70222 g.70222  ORF g.70222 m.70222 type:complete len:59 (+) comp35667_c0_seq2:3-179(+)
MGDFNADIHCSSDRRFSTRIREFLSENLLSVVDFDVYDRDPDFATWESGDGTKRSCII